MSSCQTFRNTFGKIKVEDLLDLLSNCMSSPSNEALNEISQRLNSFNEQREKFIPVYQTKVRELLVKWFPFNKLPDSLEWFSDSITFDETQRVIIEGDLRINETPAKYFPSLIREITDDLDIRYTKISSILGLEVVRGTLFAEENSSLRIMPKLKKVGGALLIQGTRVETLDSLEEVEDDLVGSDLKSLKSMASLKRVGGLLDITKTGLRSLPSLETVDKAIYMPDIPSLSPPKKALFQQQRPYVSIADFFPKLSSVGTDAGGISFWVLSEDQKNQLERLRDLGKISFKGKFLGP